MIARRMRRFIPFSEDIGALVIIIARLEFELAYLKFAVQYFSYYVIRTSCKNGFTEM